MGRSVVGRLLGGETGIRHAAVRALGAVAMGIMAGRFIGPGWWVVLVLAGAGIMLSRFTRGWSLYVLLAIAAMGYARTRLPFDPDPAVFRLERFRAVVVDEPAGRRLTRFTVRLEPPSHGLVTVWPRDTLRVPRYGDLVEIHSPIEPLSFPRNPGVMDLNEFYHRRGYVGEVSVSSMQVRVIGRGRVPAIMRYVIVPARRHAWRVIRSVLPPEEGALLASLLLGDRRDLARETRAVFQQGGVFHVLAVSGLHVGIVAGMVLLLLALVGIRGWWRFGLSVAAILLYVLFAGARAPVFRAAVMFGAVMLAWSWQRRVEPLATVSSAGLLLLLLDPNAVFDVGAQLSFAAVTAIALIAPRVRDYWRGVIGKGTIRRKMRAWVVAPLAVSAAAVVGTGPLLLHYFGRLQLLAVFFGPIVVLLVSLAVPLGFLVLLLHPVSTMVAGWFGESLRWLLWLVLRAADLFGRCDWSLLARGRLGGLAALWLYGLLALAWNWRKAWARTALAVLALVGLNVFVWNAALKTPQARVVFLDPGRGDAALFVDELGRTLLIDAGINRKGVLRDFLRSHGTRHLDVVVITHPDLDHYGGLLDLDPGCTIGHLLLSTPRGSQAYTDMVDRFETRGTRVWLAADGTVLRGLGFDVRFVWPEYRARVLHANGLLSRNNMSLVALVERDGFLMLMTGDLDDPGLLGDREVGAQLLKSPHHGSRQGNGPELFELTSPEYVVVMGRYPTPAGLDARLADSDIIYMNTRRDGGFTIRFEGSGIRVRDRGAQGPKRR